MNTQSIGRSLRYTPTVKVYPMTINLDTTSSSILHPLMGTSYTRNIKMKKKKNFDINIKKTMPSGTVSSMVPEVGKQYRRQIIHLRSFEKKNKYIWAFVFAANNSVKGKPFTHLVFLSKHPITKFIQMQGLEEEMIFVNNFQHKTLKYRTFAADFKIVKEETYYKQIVVKKMDGKYVKQKKTLQHVITGLHIWSAKKSKLSTLRALSATASSDS